MPSDNPNGDADLGGTTPKEESDGDVIGKKTTTPKTR